MGSVGPAGNCSLRVIFTSQFSVPNRLASTEEGLFSWSHVISCWIRAYCRNTGLWNLRGASPSEAPSTPIINVFLVVVVLFGSVSEA